MLKGKVVLVVGGTGSIGSEIVRQALDLGAAKVVVFSRDEIKHFMMRKRFVDDRLETVVGDIRSPRSVEQIFERFDIDILYHAAAMKHVIMCEDFPLESVLTNVLGTQHIVDLALKYKVSTMVTISTDKTAYPVNVMGACKFIAERMTLNANRLSKSDQAFSCVRFGNVANSRGSVIPVFIENLLNRTPIQAVDPEVTRFTMEIPDAVRLVIKASEFARGGEVFILKMRSFKLGTLVDVMVNRIAPKLGIPGRDVKVTFGALNVGEKLHEDLINNTESPRLYESEDMYVLLPEVTPGARYRSLVKSNLSKYSSNEVELLSEDELEQLIMKYVASQGGALRQAL